MTREEKCDFPTSEDFKEKTNRRLEIPSTLAEDDQERSEMQYEPHHTREQDDQHDESPQCRQGKMIRLEEHCVEVSIPGDNAFSISSKEEITVEAIPEVPSQLILKKDEAIISVGLKMSPPGLKFSTPVKITMPHCALFSRPEEAEIGLYTRRHDSDAFSFTALSRSSIPRCEVRHHDLDLYIDHFSERWIIAYLRSVFIGKRLLCTPYAPLTPHRNALNCVRLFIKDYISGTDAKSQDTIPGYRAAFSSEEYLVKRTRGDLRITHFENQIKVSKKRLEEAAFYGLNKHNIPFCMATQATDQDRVLVEFRLKQAITKDIAFEVEFPDDEADLSSACSNSPTSEASLQVSPVRRDAEGASKSGSPDSDQRPPVLARDASFATKRVDDLDKVRDEHILRLSKKLKPENFYPLCSAMGIDFNTADGILAEQRSDYSVTYNKLLRKWRDESPKTIHDLDKVLAKGEAGGLVSSYKQV